MRTDPTGTPRAFGQAPQRRRAVWSGVFFGVGLALSLAVSDGAGAQLLSDEDRGHYEAAFHAAELDKLTAARRHAARGGNPLLDKAIDWLVWQRAGNDAAFETLTDFIRDNPTWPRLKTLSRRAEEKARAGASDSAVLRWFDATPPRTARGFFRYAAALEASNRGREIDRLAPEAWIALNLSVAEEREFLKRFGGLITDAHHDARLERLIWDGRTTEATRQARRATADRQRLAEARIALRRFSGGVDGAIARVPAELRDDPGLIYERLRWRRRKGRDDDAIDLLLNQPIDSGANPALWWRERAVLARRALADGRISQAYRIAAEHGAETGLPMAEGEWLAGWTALRLLDDPQLAFPHFRDMYAKVRFPVSISRAAYWAGRAAEAGGEPEIAAQWYREAAQYGGSFYGQTAAARLPPTDRPALTGPVEPSAAERAAFEERELVRLARLLAEVKSRKTLRTVLRHLGATVETPQEMAMAADLASVLGRPDAAVYAARQAIKKQVLLPRAGYPLAPIAREARLGPDILFGLIRQESAFDQAAISSAGARGLMQLMPATAKSVARSVGLSYRKSALTVDPIYNIRLGDHYLAELIDDFDGSLIMALAGYNAGPHRVRRWVDRNGDPRLGVHEALDWIEQIPFSETRNYVQRVLENITIYRTRLTDRPAALSFTSGGVIPRARVVATLAEEAERKTVPPPAWSEYPRAPVRTRER
ncbi:MAG: lytic transglycosylase domain-containing protein [Alphaproteobacteria bacterium]|nr:lytic transglycosylase domain-containing protein [Alphaproteobacteria bacterium]